MPLSELTIATAGPAAYAALMSASMAAFWSAGSVWIFSTRSPKPFFKSTPSLVNVSPCLAKRSLKINAHGVAEDDRVGNLHHRRLEMQREEHAFIPGAVNLVAEEGFERPHAHAGAVDDFAGFERELVLQHDRCARGRNEFNPHRGRGGNRDRFFVRKEVVSSHAGHGGLGLGRPLAHGMRMGAGVVLHGLRRAAIGVAFAQDRVDGGALHLVVAGLDVLFGVGFGRLGIVGNCVTVGLELGDGFLQLRDGRADVGQLDDVGLGLERQRAQLGEMSRGCAARRSACPGTRRGCGRRGRCRAFRPRCPRAW